MPTKQELQQLQALPLGVKIKKTEQRIHEWVNHFGEDGVYVSFSGGKDSTVLLDIVRKLYPNIKAMFVDTGLEYPEIRNFVQSFDNVDVIKPKIGFKEVINKYGYPLISKEVSECAYGAKTYLTRKIENQTISDRQTDRQTDHNLSYWYYYEKLTGTGKYIKPDQDSDKKDISSYSQEKWKFVLDAPFFISNRCCNIMKKGPAHKYAKETKRHAITAQTASESRLRTQQWLKNGCNSFNADNPVSNPMSFWLEQDILLYITINNLPICNVYGNVINDDDSVFDIPFDDELLNTSVFDLERPCLKTSGCKRTGCIFCGYGLHLEKRPNRLELIPEVSNPHLLDYVLRGGDFEKDTGLWKPTNDGLGYWFVLQWLNVHGNTNIYIPEYKHYEEKYGNETTEYYLKE